MGMQYYFSPPLISQMITDGQLFHSPCIFKGLALPWLLPWTPGAPDKGFAAGPWNSLGAVHRVDSAVRAASGEALGSSSPTVAEGEQTGFARGQGAEAEVTGDSHCPAGRP